MALSRLTRSPGVRRPWQRVRGLTLLAVSVSNPTEQQTIQRELDLPPQDPWRPGTDAGAARRAVDGSMDRIRSRFGGDAVGYLPVVMRNAGMVPDEFRELAEHDL
jgi:DNA polymerase-4